MLSCFETVRLMHLSGSFLLSRFYTYQSQYLSALAILDIGYNAPGTDLNQTYVEAYNNYSQATFGYPVLGYWYYFDKPDAHVLLDAHVSSKTRPSMYSSLQQYS